VEKFFKFLLGLKILTINSVKGTSTGCVGCLFSPQLLSSVGIIFAIGFIIYILGLGDGITGFFYLIGGDPPKIVNNNYQYYWEEISLDTRYPLNNVYFLNEETGWAIGNAGNFFRSTNFGKDWEENNLPADAYWHYIKFFNDNDGILLGGKKLLITSNGGISWIVKNSDINVSWCVKKCVFLNINIGYIVDCYSDKFIYKTINS